jgi:hypothetical protein
MGTCISQQITQDVCYDDIRCGEFDIQRSFQADQKNHSHREDGQKKFVFHSSQTTAKRYARMQQCENMDDPNGIKSLQKMHKSAFYTTKNTKKTRIFQFEPFFHLGISPVRPGIRTVHLWGGCSLPFITYF